MTIYVTHAKKFLCAAELCISQVRDQMSRLHNTESETVSQTILWYSECFYPSQVVKHCATRHSLPLDLWQRVTPQVKTSHRKLSGESDHQS